MQLAHFKDIGRDKVCWSQQIGTKFKEELELGWNVGATERKLISAIRKKGALLSSSVSVELNPDSMSAPYMFSVWVGQTRKVGEVQLVPMK